MSELLVNTIKKADGTGSLTIPADTGTVVTKDVSNDVTLNNITATGVYLGGTGAANYLDDYEEGTWTPVFRLASTTGTILGTTIQQAYYVKVGKIVHLAYHIIRNDSSGSSDTLWMTNLPFTTSDCPQTSGGAWFDNFTTDYRTFIYLGSSNNFGLFAPAGTASNYLPANNWDNGRNIYGTVTYQVPI